MLACHRLWMTSRPFPTLPIAPRYPQLSTPWDRVFFALLLLSLVAALKFWRPAVVFFLAGLLFFVLADQNRIQAWLYRSHETSG